MSYFLYYVIKILKQYKMYDIRCKRRATLNQKTIQQKNKFCIFTTLTNTEENDSGKDIKPNSTRSKIC